MSKRLLLLLLSLVLSFLAAEGLLRLLSRSWLRVLDVEMWRYARSVKKASSYKDVVEEHQPNASAFLMGGRIRTDAQGFRLPDPATAARRRPGDRKVVALGDSLTLGWGVPEGRTFADELERRLAASCPRQPTTVWNAGIGNCNTAMELARYKRFIRPLHPSWVILGYFVNDAEPDPQIPENPFYWRSALIALLSTRLRQTAEIRLRDYRVYYHGLYDEGRPGWVRAQAALRELGALLKADGTEATLILLPELHEPHDFGGVGSFRDVYGKVAAIGRESGFEVIDPSLDFPPGPGNAFWVSPDDAHPNARAQAIFAQALMRSRYACAR